MTTLHRTIIAAALGAGLSVTALSSTAAAGQKFFPDDPIWVERDSEDASTIEPRETSLFVDIAYNLIARRERPQARRAQNVNTVDEVPDSAWFTNRLGVRELTADDVARGPNTSNGPAAGVWTITASKSDGVTPGFTVKDANGVRWFLKFDPPGYRGMATGTEVAVTKLMWALGYNVPENYIAHLRRDQLVVGRTAKVTLPNGRVRHMNGDDIDHLLARAERDADGSYRVIASKALEGTPVGRIRFEQTRPDDPNDLIPHEDRRELRGYGVFAAWLNHVDAKAINSLDTLVSTDDGLSVVRHNLIDFGSTLGSGGVGPADYWAGHQYLLEPRQTGLRMVSFGFGAPKWHTEAFYESPSIGRLPRNNEAFDPESWRPRVPNPAFLHARPDDKFWAAQRLAAMTTDMIRAAVKSGEFGDPQAEEFLVRALAERRDAILRAYLPAVNPIADPMLTADGVLMFRNAAVDADVARAPREYRARWFSFDNATGATTEIGETSGPTTRIEAPKELPRIDGMFVKVELSSEGGPASWSTPVSAYFHCEDATWRLVGFERLQ